MADSPKIIGFEAARALLAQSRGQGKRIVQSHGVFDMIHPGHICHLEEARALGDVLVVTLTADAHVRKGPGRPLFNERLRLAALAGLTCVDYVVLTPFTRPAEAIVCTTLFSRIVPRRKMPRSTAIEITAEGIDAETVRPIFSARYELTMPKVTG